MRVALAKEWGSDVRFDAQRPRGNRPNVEDKAIFRFLSTYGADEIPISGTTIGQRLSGQLQETFGDLAEPFRTGHAGKAAPGVWDLFEELGLKEGAAATIRALGTVSAAAATATWNKSVDWRAKNPLVRNILLAA